MKLAVSKYVARVGMTIVAVVAFAMGLYANLLIMPSARASDARFPYYRPALSLCGLVACIFKV